MIVFKNVCKIYGEKTVVKDLNLHIDTGKLVVIAGESGCGKTTLLKMINKLVEISKGEIEIDGVSTRQWDSISLRRRMGYVVQKNGLFPHLTIKENIQLLPKLLKEDERELDKRTDELLNLVHLNPGQYRDRYPSQLSGGEQQRVGVIRALITDPEMILMDEPFSALDPVTRLDLQDELLGIQAKFQKTILFVTHDMDEALKLADKICLLRNGEVLQYDTKDKLLAHPKDEYVVQFLGMNKQVATIEEEVFNDYINQKKPFILMDDNHKPIGRVTEEMLEKWHIIRQEGGNDTCKPS